MGGATVCGCGVGSGENGSYGDELIQVKNCYWVWGMISGGRRECGVI